MLMIRLQRIGKKKNPSYRFVVSEKTRDTQFGSLEILGIYDPIHNPKTIRLKTDRIKYWISQGAHLSETVNNLLVKEGVIEGKKMKSVSISNKRKAKINTKKAEEEQKAADTKAAEEKAKAAKAEAPVEPAAQPEETQVVKQESEAAAEAKTEEPQSVDKPEGKPVEENK